MSAIKRAVGDRSLRRQYNFIAYLAAASFRFLTVAQENQTCVHRAGRADGRGIDLSHKIILNLNKTHHGIL